MPDLLESSTAQILYQTVPEVVLFEPLGTDDLLEAPTEHTLLQLGDDHTLIEPVETLVLLTECAPVVSIKASCDPYGYGDLRTYLDTTTGARDAAMAGRIAPT